jgi:hypothetical protein
MTKKNIVSAASLIVFVACVYELCLGFTVTFSNQASTPLKIVLLIHLFAFRKKDKCWLLPAVLLLVYAETH